MAVDIFKIGSVELLVLLLLREQDAHGYQLAQLMEEKSDGLLTVKTASLYPILYRLVDTGCITAAGAPYCSNPLARAIDILS